MARDRDGTEHPARALSDGTLRFLALAVMELDPTAQGVLCLEEPENGIHPTRIPAMLRLLQDIAVDTHEPVGPENPLRQVIINTHSPIVAAEIPADSLLMALPREAIREGRRFTRVSFVGLSDTWRARLGHGDAPETLPKGRLLDYLRAVVPATVPNGHPLDRVASEGRPRVIDRADVRQLLLPLERPDE